MINTTANRMANGNETPLTAWGASYAQVIRQLHRLVRETPNEWPIVEPDGKRFRLLVANTPELRERAFRLGFRVYDEMGYADGGERELLCSRFDARPDTLILLVGDEENNDVATLTLVFDSEDDGLPLDDIFCAEADKLRSRGKRAAEIVRLAADRKIGGGREVMLHLFNFAYIYAKNIMGCDCFLITVNPRHAPYYARSLGFEMLGSERPCPKVKDAPAVLLRLCFQTAAGRVRAESGRRPRPGAKSSLYPFLYGEEAEPFIATYLAHRRQPMGPAEAERLGLVSSPGSWRSSRL